MGLPEKAPQELPERKAEEQKSELLDSTVLFPGKPLPYREVEFIGADGKEGKVLIQALTMRELDEINHIQNQPVKDARGNVIEEANQIGWDAKVIARALRKPNKTRVAGEHWPALSEQIESQWLPGTIRAVRNAVLELSGFGQLARTEQKKDF